LPRREVVDQIDFAGVIWLMVTQIRPRKRENNSIGTNWPRSPDEGCDLVKSNFSLGGLQLERLAYHSGTTPTQANHVRAGSSP
jgi:hypothetical protein